MRSSALTQGGQQAVQLVASKGADRKGCDMAQNSAPVRGWPASASPAAAPASSATLLGHIYSVRTTLSSLSLRPVCRGMLGACAASFFHGLVTATLAVQQLWHWPIVVDAVNTPAENLTLQISTVGPSSQQHTPACQSVPSTTKEDGLHVPSWPAPGMEHCLDVT